MPRTEPTVFGPQAIADIGRAVDTLMPWLAESRFQMLENGNLRFNDPEPAEAIRLLRGATEAAVPESVRDVLGRKSGLGWNVFFGHVVTWWLPQRRRMGFLRALADRADLHGIDLQLHWNEGRTVPVRLEVPGNEAIAWGAGAGVAAGVALTRIWPGDSLLALIPVAAGVVLARTYQRVGRRRVCGDALCRAPLGRRPVCASCGGIAGGP